MPKFIVHMGAQILCPHPPGQVQFTQTSQKVSVVHQKVATKAHPTSVAGCPGVPNSIPPCTQVQWTTVAMKVKVEGNFVVLYDSQGQGLPSSQPGVKVMNTQMKVQGK